jgi:hypothetical protein
MSIWYPGSGISFSNYLFLETKVGRDLAGIIQKGSDNIATKVSEQSRSIVANNYQLEQLLGRGFNSVTNEIQWGFDRIEYALQDVNSSIESLHSDFNYGITLILEQSYLTNKLLSSLINKIDDIHRTLQNPTLNESREFFNIGCIRLSKGLFDKALESFIEAEKRNDTDFFTQFQIGKLYLYGINEDANIIDLDKAKTHLLYAARYAKSEKIEDNSFSKFEAEAYFHASIAIYAQLGGISYIENPDKFNEFLLEALQLVKKAILLNPKLSEAYYHSAKYYALLNDSSSAIEYLDKAIFIDRNYAIKVDGDLAFDNIRSEILIFLNDYKGKRKVECISLSQSAETLFSEAILWNFKDSSFYIDFSECREDIIKARKSLKFDTIFGYLDALNLFEKLKNTLPVLIKNRIDSLNNEIYNSIERTKLILSHFENHRNFDTYITETKVHLSKANSCFYFDASYPLLMDALQETKEAYEIAKKADLLLKIENSQQEEARIKNLQIRQKEEDEKKERERINEIRNEASHDYAVSMAWIFGLIGLFGGCVSCLKSFGSGDGLNWDFLKAAILFALIGAIIGAISGQLKRN